MAESSLSRRYARALFSIGKESDQVDAFGNDLAAFAGVLDLGGGQLRAVLNNPGLSVPERRGVLKAVLAKLGLAQMVNNFLNLLVDKSRFSIFDGVRSAYLEMADELAGRVRASVTTATALQDADAAQISAVLSKATGRTAIVDYVVDPELIGGIVARVGDTVFDASIRTRLQDMREILSR